MRRDNSNTVPTRRRHRRALVMVTAALVPILALTLAAGHFLALPARASGTVSFAPEAAYPVYPSPTAVAIGDLNGDSKPDLVTANPNSDNVNVLLGNGDGTFAFAAAYGVGAAIPTAVAIGDLNDDGHPDLVTANPNSNNVSVLLNNGTGGFPQTAVYFVAGTGPAAVAIGDLNGDSKPDLVTANQTTSNVSVLLNNGTGGFPAALAYPILVQPSSIAIGDLNDDGHPDLVTANPNSNNVSVLLGNSNGDGTFPGNAVNYTVDTQPDSVAIGDLNGDTHLDLVTANYAANFGSGDVSVLLGNSNGDGTFPGNAVNYPTAGASPHAVAIGDLNGDGYPDLVTADINNVSVLLGNGDGTFDAAVAFPVGTTPVSVAIGNLNSDGKPDLVTANQDSNDVSVLLNTTVSGTPTPTPTAGGGGSNSAQVTLALTGGGLSASTTAAPSLSATLTGQDQTLNYLLPITVTDARATGDGWNLTITSTQFSTGISPVNTLPTNASTVISVGAVCAAGTCVNPTNAVSYPLTIPAGSAAPPPVKLFNAAVGTGMGTFTVTPSVNILIPGSTVAGTYTSTITLAIVSGP